MKAYSSNNTRCATPNPVMQTDRPWTTQPIQSNWITLDSSLSTDMMNRTNLFKRVHTKNNLDKEDMKYGPNLIDAWKATQFGDADRSGGGLSEMVIRTENMEEEIHNSKIEDTSIITTRSKKNPLLKISTRTKSYRSVSSFRYRDDTSFEQTSSKNSRVNTPSIVYENTMSNR